MQFSAKSMHVMPNFRLQEKAVLKSKFRIFIKKNFTRRKNDNFFSKLNFSAKSMHVMPNFRLQETLVFKNENIFLIQIFFYKENF